MPLYAVMAFDHPPHAMALRDKARAAHRAYVLANAGPIRCAGAMRDESGNQCGSLFVFEAESQAEILAWFADEPFHRAGVYSDIRITLWSPAYNALDPRDWPA